MVSRRASYRETSYRDIVPIAMPARKSRYSGCNRAGSNRAYVAESLTRLGIESRSLLARSIIVGAEKRIKAHRESF